MSKKMNREEWLSKVLHKHISPMFAAHGATVPADCQVSVGFPGGGSARKRIGECWPRSRSAKSVNEIFINPSVSTPFKMVEILVHEAIHAADDCASGHKGFFRRTAVAVGLEGKMTSTHAGKQLAEWIDYVIAQMPEFDHGALTLDGRKKQTTRMVKWSCNECGAIWRAAAKWPMHCCPVCGSLDITGG